MAIIELVCRHNGRILAYGQIRAVEEFLFVEIPHMHPLIFSSFKELWDWLNESRGWEIAE